jgi:DNA-binding protein HU-beta
LSLGYSNGASLWKTRAVTLFLDTQWNSQVNFRDTFCGQGASMNKGDLIDKISATNGISKTAAGGAIDTIVDAVTAALKKGSRVTLVGFGTFSTSQRKARNGRNPQTGGVIKIAARRVAKFTPGVELKKAVNKK